MKNFKVFLTSLLAAAMAMACLTAVSAFADDQVAINPTNFPDPVFRQTVSDTYDTNGDGYLNTQERRASSMTVSALIDTEVEEIKDLKGIEHFTNLKILRCSGVGLEKLDVSRLASLTSLTCQGNALTSLDVSKNSALTFLNCADNDIALLSLPAANNIETLYCYANNITSLETGYLTNVVTFRCDQNNLSSIDVTNCRKMTEFNCSQNHLTTLDLSGLEQLGAVTEYMIGNQNITLKAHFNAHMIVIPFENHGLSDSNYRGCTLDNLDDNSYFDFDSFICFDVSDIENGITYECCTNLAAADNMTVNVAVERDFSQVSFYTDASLTERVGRVFVNNGSSANAPVLTELPSCKAFDVWSKDVSAVTQDMKVYAVYKDAHNYKAVSLAADGDTVNIRCADCDSEYQTSFIAMVNKKTADSGFDKAVDVHSDGCINAKDYAVLKKLK